MSSEERLLASPKAGTASMHLYDAWVGKGGSGRSSRSRRKTALLWLLGLSIVVLLHLTIWGRYRPQDTTAIFVPTDTSVSVAISELLFAKPLSGSLQFTVDKGQYSPHAPLSRYGRHFHVLKIPDSELMLPPGTEDLWGDPYNLAILRLPSGLDWQFLAIARGPKDTMRSEKTIGGDHETMVHSLIGFGLNLMANNTFRLASLASTLNIPTHHSMGCDTAFRYIKGPEDPRIYWSDNRVPMLSFGMPASVGSCRGLALVQDVRSVFPELVRVLHGAKDTLPFHAGALGSDFIEMTREKAGSTEKNWMMFYPGATPQSHPGLPHAHFNSNPDENCKPPLRPMEGRKKGIPAYQYKYVTTPQRSGPATCARRNFPALHKNIHGATPLVRFTLCDRGTCVPDIHNTVNVAINHLKLPYGPKRQIQYSKYFSFWNVTSPFEPVAVGPEFHFNGPDIEEIVYALSLSFVPQHAIQSGLADLSQGTAKRIASEHTDTLYGTTHGFLDDRVFVGLGLKDNEMATIEVSVKDEILNGLRDCQL